MSRTSMYAMLILRCSMPSMMRRSGRVRCDAKANSSIRESKQTTACRVPQSARRSKQSYDTFLLL